MASWSANRRTAVEHNPWKRRKAGGVAAGRELHRGFDRRVRLGRRPSEHRDFGKHLIIDRQIRPMQAAPNFAVDEQSEQLANS
jgi:hypothetical protein